MKNFSLFVSIGFVLAACIKDHDTQPRKFLGPTVGMDNRTARSWISLDAAGYLQSLGFTLSARTLENLPTTAAMSDFMLALPDEASELTPFQSIMINWNPMGHEPPGIYDVPHFDFHFYMLPINEVMSIPPYEQAVAKYEKPGNYPTRYSIKSNADGSYELAMSEYVKR